MDIIRTKILEYIALGQEFSDIQINTTLPIRIRTSSGLLPLDGEPVSDQDLVLFLRNLRQSAEDWDELLDTRGGSYDFGASLDRHRFRCNLYRYGGGLRALTMRKLNAKAPQFERLGLPDTVLKMAERSKGIMLVTGPTGSGKSTTLAAIINHINQTRYNHIVTIEDPIEYEFKSHKSVISQREVGRDCATFGSALRAALRQHPDVIMVGELRDHETVETALSAAESGHLVLATLHTINAVKTIERISNFFNGPDRVNVQNVMASVLIGVVSQALVESTNAGGYELCYEVMINTSAVQTAIRDGKLQQIPNLMATGSQDGMLPMNKVLAKKVRANAISRKGALYFTYDPQDLERELNNA